MKEALDKLFGVGQAAKQAAREMTPGLKNIGQDIADTFVNKIAQGSSEIVSALYSGQGYVMYSDRDYGFMSSVQDTTQEQMQQPMNEQLQEASQGHSHVHGIERDTGRSR